MADGTASHRPENAVGLYLADGTVLAVSPFAGFAGHAAEGGARFVDYDGAVQAAPDLTTHGMRRADGRRIYVDVYPTLVVPAVGQAVRAAGAPGGVGPRDGGTIPTTGGEYAGGSVIPGAAVIGALALWRAAGGRGQVGGAGA